MFKSAWSIALVAIAALALLLPAAATAAKPPPKVGSLTEVGSEPLLNRGMNSAMAINGDYAYIGSRTDGAHEGMPHGGMSRSMQPRASRRASFGCGSRRRS